MSNSTGNTGVRFDAVIVGGGAAGLSGAVALGRSLRTVLVVDKGEQRNLPSDAAHNVIAREGISPAELVAEGRREAASYGVEFADDAVISVERDGDFTVCLGSGRIVKARRLLLATGLVDELPRIPGVQEAWGHGVLHCPYCHGYEVRGRRIGVIATTSMGSVHQALLFAQLSRHVTVFAGSVEFDDQQRAELRASGISVVEGEVERVIEHDREVSGVQVDGRVHDVDNVVVGTRMMARTALFEQLGGVPQDHPFGQFIPSDPTGATGVDGVWTAGNAGNLAAMVSVAAGAGLLAGVAINADLVTADVRSALV
ncbi:NAD(P)/FAD-dependent oxidoreductase [Gordonia sp. PDNC005]|uniref:NAD(P)/FAD-dependent oxidoreductase n=1 Tax=unclassified Gordonia (in: high G+C Gram-positive bacteria) TaxID=2657482 RepID=UPI0019636F84|nr:NAD(P)/FAD-dependent oxidoreductase [Gordonia sp. PDNC005]QRY64078.1 NAD(P)/FAD-dependent oxidoreductase [Gordonia sp. PDNC005]